MVQPVATAIVGKAEGIRFGPGASADTIIGFEDRDGLPRLEQGPCGRQAGGTGTDDDDIGFR